MTIKSALIVLIVALCHLSIWAQTNSVNTTSELMHLSTNDEIIVVKDALSGGIFAHVDSSVNGIDQGVIYKRIKGGYWQRNFDRSTGVNPCWWGAKGDGINDDLPAIKAATAYCLQNETIMQFPSGVFRITGQWVIGAKSIGEEDLFKGTANRTFKIRQHEIARKTAPLIIRGSIRTCIYGDFAPTVLTAIIFYNIYGCGLPKKPSAHLYTHEFSNIGVYGKDFFKGKIPTPPDSANMNNNQIGLAIYNCTNPKIDGCNFSGLKYGLIFKTSYFGSIKNCHFELCRTGLYTSDYNANLIENIDGDRCNVFAEINGTNLVVNNFNTEFCATTLILSGRNIVFNGMYCENYKAELPNHCQLIFGINETDSDYSKKTADETSRIIINGLSVSAIGRDAILFKNNVHQININAGNINGNIITTNTTNKIVLDNVIGIFKLTGPGVIKKTE
ncbi:MAG: hypothetical protein JWR61_479 [Ferruginibacter sp.]|uniref:hypothetical protein n=1 Tax=Ferruginibacter sp. TaxID=1940288 RepID=UPI002659DE9C|nr:hypothetical protein [Ferruginibacter sp.]MDB5275524.1 hypothetical protein [Ferruginibacter sp.]